MRYSLGLDIGSESVGWGLVELDENDEPVRIVRMGVRAFDAVRSEASNATTPAEERRVARSQRRRLRRRRRRLRRLAELLAEHRVVNSREELEAILQTRPGDLTPWQLRVQGLDRRLEPREWARVLFHIARHRGFKSTRRAEQQTAEGDEAKKLGAMLQGISEIHQALERHGYRTVAEYFESPQWEELHGGQRHNKGGEYICTIGRDDLLDEVRQLFEAQRRLGNPYASPEMESAYVEIVNEPPKLAEGPELMSKVGRCFLEPAERRAPKGTLTAQRFRALQTLVNQTLTNVVDGRRRRLTPDEIAVLMDEALKVKKVTYKRALKALGLDGRDAPTGERWLFEVRGRRRGRDLEEMQGETLIELKEYHQLKDALEKSHPEVWERIRTNPELFDEVAAALTYWLRPDSARQALIELGIEPDVAERLARDVAFDGHMRLSLKAMRTLIPYLQQGFVYSDACKEAGYDHSQRQATEKHDRIPPLDSLEDFQSITNPNVKRALTQARKVVNAIIAEYGKPDRIVVELAREAALTPKERREIEREQIKNRKEKERRFEQIREIAPTANPERVWRKHLLYEQQGGRCAYSMKPLDLVRVLTDPTYTEIDHIVPRSVSFDDSMANKVLVLTAENRNKGDELAAVYVRRTYGEQHYEQFQGWVKSLHAPTKKKRLLLTEELSEEQRRELQGRYLVSTQYAARYFLGVLKQHLDVPKVLAANGRLTADLRYHLGLGSEKDRQASDKHHAVDATICALVNEKVVHRMARYFQALEETVRTPEGIRVNRFTGEMVEHPVLTPWDGFREDVLEHLNHVIVSRMPNRRLTGRGHKETIYSLKHVRKHGLTVPKRGRVALPSSAPRPTKRTRLSQLSDKQIEQILKKPSPILVDEAANWRLYDRIRERLVHAKEGSGKTWAERAFGPQAEPLRMPTNDGRPGPIVRSIRLYTDTLSGIAVRGGMAENDTIVRLDIYRKVDKKGKAKHAVVPVYAADVAAGWTPRPADADDTHEFLFSLHPGDYFRVWKKPDEPGPLLYMTSFDRARIQIAGNLSDRSNRSSAGSIRPVRVSVVTAARVDKIEVDLLGRAHAVRRERHP